MAIRAPDGAKNSMSSKETLRAASWFLRMRRVIARLCFSNRKIRSCREKVSFCVVWLVVVFNLLSNEVIAVSEHSTLVVVAHCSFGVPGRQDL